MKNPWIVGSLMSFLSFSVLSSEISFYTGLSGGGAYSQAEISKITNIHVMNSSDSSLPASSDTHRLTGVGQIQLGTGINYGFLYLGLEVQGQFSDGDFDSINTNFTFLSESEFIPTSKQHTKNELSMRDFEPSVDFKPGIFLSDNTLLYGRVGAAFNELKLKEHSHYNLVNSNAVTSVKSSHSDNVVALRLGLGVEHHLHERLSILMDYTYTNYGDISLTTTDSVHAPEFDITFDLNTKTKTTDISKQVVMVGLNYYL